MHEWLLTRADLGGAPDDLAIQAYTRYNVVLLHPGRCHHLAQFYPRAKNICARHILRFYSRESVLAWLNDLRLDAKWEAIRYIEGLSKSYGTHA